MKGTAFYFFLAAVISVTIGMAWGIQMSASQDHTLSGAHAHLNLVGWVTLALFGLYYHVTPQAASTRLASIHLIIALLGVITMVPGIVIAIQSANPMLAIVGSFLSIGSMLIFLYTVWKNGLGTKA